MFSNQPAQQSLDVLISNGDGTFHENAYSAGAAAGSAIADFNSDGIPDIAVADGDFAYIFLGNGDGTFRQGATISDPTIGYVLVAADFNHDGKIDLASPNINNYVTMLLGNGDGTFTNSELLGCVTPLYGYAVANLHGDDKLGPDIVTTGGDAVLVLLNGTK